MHTCWHATFTHTLSISFPYQVTAHCNQPVKSTQRLCTNQPSMGHCRAPKCYPVPTYHKKPLYSVAYCSGEVNSAIKLMYMYYASRSSMENSGMYRVFCWPVLLFIVHAHFATSALIMLRSIYPSTKPTRTITHNTARVPLCVHAVTTSLPDSLTLRCTRRSCTLSVFH